MLHVEGKKTLNEMVLKHRKQLMQYEKAEMKKKQEKALKDSKELIEKLKQGSLQPPLLQEQPLLGPVDQLQRRRRPNRAIQRASNKCDHLHLVQPQMLRRCRPSGVQPQFSMHSHSALISLQGPL